MTEQSNASSTGRPPMGRVLVTGGCGLTGRALVSLLRSQDRDVRVLDLIAHPDVPTIVGDICDPSVAAKACDGVDVVFHTVAIVTQHPRKTPLIRRVNVAGTQVMLDAAQAAGVRRFVFTSSIDVVFDGSDISAGDESLPYAERFLDAYGRSKADAERLVLAANGQAGMATTALRAAGIFGPHDQHRLPVALAYIRRNGFVRLGDGGARFSHVYVDNLAHAHVLAAEALTLQSAVAGQAYFITDHKPTNFFDFLRPYVEAAGLGSLKGSIPGWVAWGLGCAFEGVYIGFGRFLSVDPVMTRYTVAAVCRDFWFVHDKATRDFGYEPVVSEDDALQRTLAWVRTL